jgi:hypothetical protein
MRRPYCGCHFLPRPAILEENNPSDQQCSDVGAKKTMGRLHVNSLFCVMSVHSTAGGNHPVSIYTDQLAAGVHTDEQWSPAGEQKQKIICKMKKNPMGFLLGSSQHT